MKFVALLSGGKDSCYNAEICIKHSHELICVANLHPPLESGVDEVNSYMYQSAAFTAIPVMAECLGVPLYRQAMRGTAVMQCLDYETTEGDEVEDLFDLLKSVKAAHPDIRGVSCGTIVSSYQRYRVENVCQRLGLTPLTYLWQRDREDLLTEMIDSGVNAVLVKVAGAGLDPDKHLGKSLSALLPTLHRLHNKFDLDFCGEGGEYESLVLDCKVFKKRLVITSSEIVYDDEDPSVGFLRVLSCDAVDKDHLMEAQVTTECSTTSVPISLGSSADEGGVRKPCVQACVQLNLDADGYGYVPTIYPRMALAKGSDVRQQTRDILSQLEASLHRLGLDIKDMTFCSIYVDDMGIYESMNDEYCTWFNRHPPSRSCVAVRLPPGVRVALDGQLLADSYKTLGMHAKSRRREVLHVRSISEWAPVCIGPYAQANILHRSWYLVAGQIGLNPATMEIVADSDERLQNIPHTAVLPKSFNTQLYQAIKNTNQILISLNSSLVHSVMFIVYVSHELCSGVDYSEVHESARQCALHVVNESTKIRQNSGSFDSNCDSCSDSVSSLDEDVNFPVLVVGVCSLPRNAMVEVEVTATHPKLTACGGTTGSMRTDSKEIETSAVDDSSARTVMKSSALWSESHKCRSLPSTLCYLDSKWSKCDTCFCCGYASLSLPEFQDYVDTQHVADTLLKSIQMAMLESRVKSSNLRQLKVYVAEDFVCPSNDLIVAITSSIAKVLHVHHMVPQVMLVQSMEKGRLIAAQFSFISFIQINGELWINGN
mmetsp:Transcript_24646/g.36297  ORF Transcript_24646/g.36297 Transcript_24646/m.36297 type:complete len:769 (-) Transcript_24646:20-2326(-)